MGFGFCCCCLNGWIPLNQTSTKTVKLPLPFLLIPPKRNSSSSNPACWPQPSNGSCCWRSPSRTTPGGQHAAHSLHQSSAVDTQPAVQQQHHHSNQSSPACRPSQGQALH